MTTNIESFGASAVEFRSPFHHRALRTVKAICSAILFTLMVGVLLYGISLLIWQSPPAGGLLSVWGLSFVMLIVVMIWAVDRYEPSRIILTENDFWIGGRFSGRRANYDEIQLLRQETPENSIGKVRQVVIERRRGRPLTIWFSADDAERCFQAIRAMGEHAPAIDHDQLLGPTNPEYEDAARQVLITELRHKARRALIAAIASIVLGIGILASVIVQGGGWRGWIAAAALLVGGGGALGSYLRDRYSARSLDDENGNNKM